MEILGREMELSNTTVLAMGGTIQSPIYRRCDIDIACMALPFLHHNIPKSTSKSPLLLRGRR